MNTKVDCILLNRHFSNVKYYNCAFLSNIIANLQ